MFSLPMRWPPKVFKPQVYYDGETSALRCCTTPNNTHQDLDVADITFSAAYLRAYGRQTRAGRLFTMRTDTGFNCEEWVLYAHNSVSTNAKHLITNTNSSVLFENIASTINGCVFGSGATNPFRYGRTEVPESPSQCLQPDLRIVRL